MTAKQEAKNYIENRLVSLFGSDYIATENGKIYVWGKDNTGNKYQVAISLTNPVKDIDVPENKPLGFDWSEPVVTAPETIETPKPTAAEKETIADLLAKMGF